MVERALAFLGTWLVILPDGSIKIRVGYLGRRHIQTSTTTSVATTLWSIREGWCAPCCPELRPLLVTPRIETRSRLTLGKHYAGMVTRGDCWRGQTHLHQNSQQKGLKRTP